MPDWPHAPIHRFNAEGTFFVTAGTYLKHHFYRTATDLDSLRDRLFDLAKKHDCNLEAWCLFSNHYHLVVNGDGNNIYKALSQLHSIEGHERNRIDRTPGRKVWYQFRETQLTFHTSWMARLRYTHENAVHHGLVRVATAYPWCSASWFERTGRPAFVKAIGNFGIERISIRDEFEVLSPEGGGKPPHSK